MKKPLLAVKDIVEITGITARTLHYYDRIDLFKPVYVTENGYRFYDRSSLEKLQTILFLKEMDFSLKEIAVSTIHPFCPCRSNMRMKRVSSMEKQRGIKSLRGSWKNCLPVNKWICLLDLNKRWKKCSEIYHLASIIPRIPLKYSD